MRKLNKAIAAVTTLAIAASMAVPAFAASPITATSDSDAHDITANFTLPDIVYYVDVDWGNMEFTYNAGTWNTETLSYDNAGWKSTTNTVKVTNKSNTDVTVGFTASITTDQDNITPEFSIKTWTLDSAAKDVHGTNAQGTATDVTSTLTLSGRPSQALAGVIGNATVTLK